MEAFESHQGTVRATSPGMAVMQHIEKHFIKEL